jgi:hypothetical protein
MGTLTLPNGGDLPYPVVLFFQGFTSTRDEIDLKTPFFEDLYSLDPVAAMSTVQRPLLVVVGGKDKDVAPQPHYGQLYLNYHEGPERLVVVVGDHAFNVMSDQTPVVLDDVIAWSIAWLQQTLPAPLTR